MLLYRVLPGSLIQFGCAADPSVQARWQDATFPDEPNRVTFRGGTLSYAGSGTDSRTCHLFVALSPNGAALGNAAHEATIGHVQEVGVFEKVAANFEKNGYSDLGELQAELVRVGNAAASAYPDLDRILSAEIVA
jgi:peptidyl-prolyl cis-trans isomerase A (cyclophilin A)